MSPGFPCALLLACLTLGGPAAADQPTLLAIAEFGVDGHVHFWWDCRPQPQVPLTDELSPRLARLGLRVVDRCDRAKTPIHKSYHRAPLRAHQAVNLASVVGAQRVVQGTSRLVQKKGHPELGLLHVEAQLELTVREAETSRELAVLRLSANGFARDLDRATSRARTLLLARLVPKLPRLAVSTSDGSKATARIRLKGFERQGLVDDHVSSLTKIAAVRSATIVELSRDAAVIEVLPSSATTEALAHLRSAGLQAEALAAAGSDR